MSSIERLLIVEDQEAYRDAARSAFKNKRVEYAIDYDEAMAKIASSDLVITDVFFPQSQSGNSEALQSEVLDAIKYGTVKDYIQQMASRAKDVGVVCDARLERCFEIMGYHHLSCDDERVLGSLNDSVMRYMQTFGQDSIGKLEGVLRDMLIENSADRAVSELFQPLKDYMAQDKANQPFGYLVAQEAERLGKRFVLATSLRHAEKTLHPILKSAKNRGWDLLEGGHGSKDDPGFWKQAYDLVSGKGR